MLAASDAYNDFRKMICWACKDILSNHVYVLNLRLYAFSVCTCMYEHIKVCY